MRRGGQPPLFKLLTVNVNGLGVAGRAQALFYYQQHVACRPDATFVQEVKLGGAADLESVLQRGCGPGDPWRGSSAFSPGTSDSRGTAILTRPGLALPGRVQQPATTDAAGRVVCWDWEVVHHRLRLLSIYAPAQRADRGAFFQQLRPFLETDRIVLLGGDLNCVLQRCDEEVVSAHRAAGAAELAALMQEFHLQDAWSVVNGQQAGFTFPAASTRSPAARLDRWLVSSRAVPWVKSVEVVPGAPGDHHGVLLSLQMPDLPPLGRRGWSFPSYLLYHPQFLPRLQDGLTQELAQLQLEALTDPRASWEVLKGRLRILADRLHRQHTREQSAAIQGELLAAKAALAAQAATPPGSPAYQRAALACHRLSEAVRLQAGRRQAALDAAYTQHGDRGTGWFHQLGREARTKEPITHLAVPGSVDPVSLAGPAAEEVISAAAHAAYSSDSPTGLFRVEEVDSAAQEELLAHLRRTLPASLRDAADATPDQGRLSLADLTGALASCANGTAPGTDGLPYDVYKVLWQHLGEPLLAAANAAFDAAPPGASGSEAAAALPCSWLEGLITLLYKGKSLPRHLLPSYRPITLLQCDYKVVCKAVSNRLQPALDFLVDALQTAFILGRTIDDNILYHLALLDWVQRTNQPAAMLFLDIEKAYDRVHRMWLHRVVEAMGFGPNMQLWLRLLTADGTARVAVNGLLSSPFPVRNGLPQGSTLSPVLWVLQLEPLTSYLHHLVQSGRLRTPLLPGGLPAPPASHHADDTGLVVQDVAVDGPVAKEAVQLFCRASNAKENASKGWGITLGSHPPITGVCPVTGAQFAAAGERGRCHLGLPLTTDTHAAAGQCYAGRIGRLRSIARGWARHGLSMVGRVHIAKQVLGNSLAYHFSFLRPTPPQLAAIRQAVNGFVATSLLPEDASLVNHGRAVLLPTPVVACQDRLQGGIGHLDLDSFLAALHAKPIAKLALPGRQPWKLLTRALLAEWAPPGTAGWGWVYGAAPIPADLPPRLAGLVEAYRSTFPGPCALPEETPAAALLCEPLFHNPALRDPASGNPFQPPPAPPAELPVTLQHLRGAPPSVRQLPLLQAVLEALPAEWRCFLPERLEDPLPPSPVWRASPDRGWVLGPDARLYQALVSGRLVPPAENAQLPDGSHAWPAACVIPARKPRRLWSLEEREAYAAAEPSEKPSAWPVEPQLLDLWASVQCYPLALGHDRVPLVHYTVSHVRQGLTARWADAELGPSSLPALPAAWPTATAGPVQSHLQHLEASWEADRPRPGVARFQQQPPALPAWMQPRAAGSPARSPAASPSSPSSSSSARRSPRLLAQPAGTASQPMALPAPGQVAAPPPPQGGAVNQPPSLGPAQRRKLWARLWDCPADNRAKVLLWRLQHGRLPCGLYLAAKHQRSDCHLCPAPPCVALPSRQRPRDSLTHLFLVCPEFAAARSWLQQLWVAVAGGAGPPVDCPHLMLGDCSASWPAYPSEPGPLALWTVLRATWLHAVWSAHHRRHRDPPSSAAVVEHVVRELQRLMWARFRMAALPDDTLSSLPQSHLTAQLRPTRLDAFEACWAHRGVLCQVSRPEGGGPKLRVFLSLAVPVAAPLLPAGVG